MKTFMLFIREDLEEMKKLSEAENERLIQVMLKWVEDLSKTGNFVAGEPLEPEVRLARPDTILYDGPFIESKEAVSGYMILTAETIDQASELAQGCPLLGSTVKSIEVRPILKF